MTNAPAYEEGVKVMERFIRLVKPGGWIQIVDGAVPTEPIEENDTPNMKIFKTSGQFLQHYGLNPMAGKQGFEMMEKAGDLKAVGKKDGGHVREGSSE
jgi:gliotoxin biosynthesis N-methyltransferase